MKGDEKLWSILNDKLDTLRATNRLPQAIRVAETALEIAKRAFPGAEMPLATSFEKLGQLLEQNCVRLEQVCFGRGARNFGKDKTTGSTRHFSLRAPACV